MTKMKEKVGHKCQHRIHRTSLKNKDFISDTILLYSYRSSFKTAGMDAVIGYSIDGHPIDSKIMDTYFKGSAATINMNHFSGGAQVREFHKYFYPAVIPVPSREASASLAVATSSTREKCSASSSQSWP